ncbi:pyridoxal phosphate-dependent decarboxylase family protein [Antarctobacter sp.]|uniref:pyridoxal phosphate-dependent decarboxylase family protein n=1 Tax=Antarctobacter sp. TaxID=1872577 RepID=UPI003A9430F5
MDVRTEELPEETLDPATWDELQALARRVVDDGIAHVRDVRDRPLWRDIPAEVKAAFCAPLPRGPSDLPEVYQQLCETLMPYPMGNIHPRFWMWYMGSGSYSGALAEFMAAIDGSNLGGGNNAAAFMDTQVVTWLKQMMGFPETASGTLVSGGSMANIIGLTTARNVKAGIDLRAEGVAAIPRPLRFYGSDQIHSCHQKAVELLGLGNKALRRVPTGPDYRMDVEALRAMIAEDRKAGCCPAAVIATAGTVNTGAIDDLAAIGALCRDEDLWFHVDGCIGALIAIAPENGHLVAGLERADSVALDPHKWLHVPFEAGCALVRDGGLHRDTFAVHPEYLEEKPRGIAANEYLHDYNLQTSRAFRALKVWMTLKEHGVDKFGRLIDQNIAQAAYLEGLIAEVPELEMMAPREINIVCFRYRPSGVPEGELRALNTEIMLRMQEAGIAALSDTTVDGRHCLRVAICNHRTRRADLDLLVREILRIGAEVVQG